ncbi:hypothetical protein AMS68_001286 [Peltaster fructicola]|uniref:SH3 domain-containing protein n=1 Tax=Peltaster fructicola TaxID=286661 RepID=A0A6H0XMB5_9PEZI|nr:hypothetical protein AMS68_001286 [Peltaster fructicola]
MPATVAGSDGPTVQLSFANNFWGKEDAGVSPLLTRMHNAKVTGDELKNFYAIRAQIEEDYARKLLNLARKPLGSSEQGTLRMSLDVVRGEVESMGKQHQIVAAQMKSELEEPLAAFTGGIKERRKIVQNGIEKLLKTKTQQTMTVTKARDRFEQDCLKIKGYLAQGHMVMGQEERKNKAKLEKTQIQMSTNSNEYEAAVKILEETTGRWNREWKAGCDKFQDLEEERIDFFKSSLWSFANISSTVCVSDDQSCEKVRLSLEDCEVEKDITNFIKECGTGQEIPDPPKYINFCRGDVDDSASIRSEEEYSVAQFPRAINPAFRTSSPQPSTLESHHDPDSSLREEMGLAERAPEKRRPSVQETFDPRASARSERRGSVQESFNPQASAGSTQYPSFPPPSERSQQPSPTRPESSGSLQHSDYTNPTSISDVEPVDKYNASNVSSAPSIPEEQPRKKSGFFQSHSPFRRRSQKQKEAPASVTPTSRNTWVPRNDENISPTKSRPWQQKQPSPSPDPVDPRADYQLGIGNNVFDVDHPGRPATVKDGVDPMAAALAELKGMTKQSASRTSADRHYGMGTPAPDARPAPEARSAPYASQNNGRAPPPAYDQPMSHLGAPRPAHTSREMQKTTERYVNQGREMYNAPAPRAASPNPQRSVSPRPDMRAASPNPYGRPRPQSMGPVKANAPYQPRAASPNPSYARPASSRGQDMALQLAPQSDYRQPRPQSGYYGNDGAQALATRTRSQSQGTQRRVTKDGRPILHYSRAMYMYQAAIPEELSFAKGDILAVLRLQDDGWWEAEIVGKNGRPGLVPSNYLKNC